MHTSLENTEYGAISNATSKLQVLHSNLFMIHKERIFILTV